MSRKKIAFAASAVVVGALAVSTIFLVRSGVSTRPRPHVQFVAYTNSAGLKLALFAVSNSTSRAINLRTHPAYVTGDPAKPALKPLQPSKSGSVAIPHSPGTTSVRFEFFTQTSYPRACLAAWRAAGLRGAIRVGTDTFSGPSWFARWPEYDSQITLPE